MCVLRACYHMYMRRARVRTHIIIYCVHTHYILRNALCIYCVLLRITAYRRQYAAKRCVYTVTCSVHAGTQDICRAAYMCAGYMQRCILTAISNNDDPLASQNHHGCHDTRYRRIHHSLTRRALMRPFVHGYGQ